MDVNECIYCGEAVELAEDGAWQGVEDGACGCMASVEQGGDGEHDGDGGGACAKCGAPTAFRWAQPVRGVRYSDKAEVNGGAQAA